MAVFDRPSAISRSTSRLARAEPLERVAAAAAGEQLRHDLGVERGAAGGDPAQGLDELADVRDPVLEQVARRRGCRPATRSVA